MLTKANTLDLPRGSSPQRVVTTSTPSTPVMRGIIYLV
jgi:hypothetical protein